MSMSDCKQKRRVLARHQRFWGRKRTENRINLPKPLKINSVVCPDAATGDSYQSGFGQHLHVVTDGWLADLKTIDHIASADRFFLRCDETEDFEAGGIAKCLEYADRCSPRSFREWHRDDWR